MVGEATTASLTAVMGNGIFYFYFYFLIIFLLLIVGIDNSIFTAAAHSPTSSGEDSKSALDASLKWPCGATLLTERLQALGGFILSSYGKEKLSSFFFFFFFSFLSFFISLSFLPSLLGYPIREPLEVSDVVELREKVKHMNIIATSRGTNYRFRALALCADPIQQLNLYERAIVEYKEALASSPNNQVYIDI